DVHDFRDPWIESEPETILLHHGFARSLKWWQHWVPVLARLYRVIRYDVRGCGGSSVPSRDGDWSAMRLIKDALELLDHLSVDSVHWVGFESGAVLGELFAAEYPERIRSLTLINGPAMLPKDQLDRFALGEKDSLAAIERYGFPEWVRRTNPWRLDLQR